MSPSSARTGSCWCFRSSEAPRMARGKGVRMQRYKDGGVADAKVFALKDGLTWTDASEPRLHDRQGGTQGLDRPSRRSGTTAAERISEE